MTPVKQFLQTVIPKVGKDENPDLNTSIHFDLGHEAYTIAVKNGVAELSDGLVGDPEITLKATPEDFAKIVSGELNPVSAMMFGKLKTDNPAALLKYAKLLSFM